MDYYGYGGYGVWAVLVWLIAIGAAVGLAFIPATIARNKGYSYGGFWALGFFFFLIALIVSLCLTDKRAQAYPPQYQQPYQPPAPPPQYQQPYQPYQPQTMVCPNCRTVIGADSVFCSRCGAKVK